MRDPKGGIHDITRCLHTRVAVIHISNVSY